MNKNRLAVLISGSFRNFDEIWPLNKARLDELQVEYEVIFQTWGKNPSLDLNVLDNLYNNKFYFSPFIKRFKPFLESFNVQQISSIYGFSSIQVQEFDEKSISIAFNLGSLASNDLFRSQLNSCGMYLGIDSVFQQLKLRPSYTHFLRLRPDFVLDSEAIKEVFNNDLVFFGQLLPTPEGPIGDQCYGGPLSKSEFILDTLSELKRITSNETWSTTSPTMLAENVIRRHLAPHRSSLKILFLDGCGAIARPELILDDHPLSLGGLRRILEHNFQVVFSKTLSLTKRVGKTLRQK